MTTVPGFTGVPPGAKVALYDDGGHLIREVPHENGHFEPALEVEAGQFVALLLPRAGELRVFRGSRPTATG